MGQDQANEPVIDSPEGQFRKWLSEHPDRARAVAADWAAQEIGLLRQFLHRAMNRIARQAEILAAHAERNRAS